MPFIIITKQGSLSIIKTNFEKKKINEGCTPQRLRHARVFCASSGQLIRAGERERRGGGVGGCLPAIRIIAVDGDMRLLSDR